MDARRIDHLAGQVLAQVDGDWGPPVDIARLAFALGVTSIQQVPMVEDGSSSTCTRASTAGSDNEGVSRGIGGNCNVIAKIYG